MTRAKGAATANATSVLLGDGWASDAGLNATTGEVLRLCEEPCAVRLVAGRDELAPGRRSEWRRLPRTIDRLPADVLILDGGLHRLLLGVESFVRRRRSIDVPDNRSDKGRYPASRPPRVSSFVEKP
jgi:hypothetical protein